MNLTLFKRNILRLLPFILAAALTAGCVLPGSGRTTSARETPSPAVTVTAPVSTPQPDVSFQAAGTPPAPAAAFMPSLSGIVEKVLPSVVFIVAETPDPVFGPDLEAGTGVILRQDGYILTNRHVVESATNLYVVLHDRRIFDVAGVWLDDVVDLAVIKIDETGLPAASWADPVSFAVGDWVVAVGHAMGFSPQEGGATATDGIISSLGRSITVNTVKYYDLIQTSAAINPGNSGGPLVNMDGEVIGITSVGASAAQNIGFAINVNTARHVYEDLVQYGEPHHPFLGVEVDDITPQAVRMVPGLPLAGAIITLLDPQSPALRKGLQIGDVIIRINGVDVMSAADLVTEVWKYEVGDKVEIAFLRGTETITATISLGARPQTRAI